MLYEIEHEIRCKPAATRCEVRQAHARSLIDELHSWLNTMLTRLSRKSDKAMAIRYALARWRALSCYLDDGSIEIDNDANRASNGDFNWVTTIRRAMAIQAAQERSPG